jgi:hypothetical protein
VARRSKYLLLHLSGRRVLISKPTIFGWGINLQCCAHVVTFASHSYEQTYQSVRRCWRFGQKRPVTVDVVYTEGETRVRQRFVVAAPATGRLLRVALEEGDPVAVDDVVARIVPPPRPARSRRRRGAPATGGRPPRRRRVSSPRPAGAGQRDLERAERLRNRRARRRGGARASARARCAIAGSPLRTAAAEHGADAARAVLWPAARTPRSGVADGPAPRPACTSTRARRRHVHGARRSAS